MSRIEWNGTLRQREPRVRDKAYKGWIARLPCFVCMMRGVINRQVHVAHVRAAYPDHEGWREVGKAEKPSDHRIIPLCPYHHMDGPDAQHRHNERRWYERWGVLPPLLCAALRKAYESREDGADVIRRAAHGDFAG